MGRDARSTCCIGRLRWREKKSTKKSVKVETLKHKDKPKNIPTEELRDFVAEHEEKPPVVLYPRDPSLDLQLVWKGKDEQDAEDLTFHAGNGA